MSADDPVGLGEFKIPLRRLAPLTPAVTRAGVRLQYRLYKAWSPNLVILYHGVGGDSRYLAPLALALAEADLANVVTPDLRGHGEGGSGARVRLGFDEALWTDFEELLVVLRRSLPAEKLILGGHSLGGGFAAKVLSSPGAGTFAEAWLFAPFLGVAVAHKGFGGWLERDAELWRVRMPEAYRRGEEVLEYDDRFFRAAQPASLEALAGIPAHVRTRVLLGGEDRVIDSERSRVLLAEQGIACEVLEGASHLGVVTSKRAHEWVKAWL